MPARRPLLPFLAAVLLLSWIAAPAASDEETEVREALRSSVRFLSPSAGEVLYGTTRISALVSPPRGATVEDVTFYVDGKIIEIDHVAPFETAWNAGEKLGSHTLRVVAEFSDGTSDEDTITTRGLELSEHEIVRGTPIEHTELLVMVVNRDGEPVDGLKREDFAIRDSGDKVKIQSFGKLSEMSGMALSITILVDRSGSMRFKMEDWRRACVEMLSVLRPIDQVRVAAFAERTAVLQDFTHDALGLATSLEKTPGIGGGTFLFRSLLTTMRDMRDLPGRKAVFVLTDGLGTEFADLGGLPGQKLAVMTDSLEKLASRADVTLMTVLPSPPTHLLPIQKLSAETGGWWFMSTKDLGARLRQMARQLLGAYVVGYDVEHSRSPDRKRRITVTLTREHGPGWEVRTSLGAYGHLDLTSALAEDLDQGTPEQKVRAAGELARVTGKRALDSLVDALKDENAAVRAAAVKALAERRDPDTLKDVLGMVRDDDWTVRETAYAAAVRYGSPAIRYLTKIAGKDVPGREGALRALGAIGDPAVLPTLQEAMTSDPCPVRAAAADGAGVLLSVSGAGLVPPAPGEPDVAAAVVDLLKKGLDDTCPVASDAAAIALGRMGRPEALPHLIGIAMGGGEERRQGQALLILTSYLSPPMFRMLERRLVSETPTSPEDRHRAGALYAAALRTAAWLGSKEGLARIETLGPAEAHEVLSALDALGGSIGADPAWRARVKALLEKYPSSQAPPPPQGP